MQITMPPSTIATHSDSRIHNSQSQGVGCLTSINGHLVINNLGRNIEVCRWSEGELRRIAAFEETFFPDDDESSQFDMDMHAFLVSPSGDELLAINHYGFIRIFDVPWRDDFSAKRELLLQQVLFWPGDVEQFTFAKTCLLSTSPNGHAVSSGAKAGLLISRPWQQFVQYRPSEGQESIAFLKDLRKIDYLQVVGGDEEPPVKFELCEWGLLTAIAVDRTGSRLALAADKRIGVFDLIYDENGAVSISKQLTETVLPFSAVQLWFSNYSDHLIATGYDADSSSDRYFNWDQLGGGGWARIILTGSPKVSSCQFDIDLGWGSSGVPLVLSRDERTLFGVDKSGCIFSWDVSSGERHFVSGICRNNDTKLGIAHMTLLENTLFCGFNRDGYRLHVFTLS